MQRMAVNPSTAAVATGATSSPHRPVNTTRLMTRGLVSARKSRQSAGRAAGFVISMAGIGGAYKGLARRGKARETCWLAMFMKALLCVRE